MRLVSGFGDNGSNRYVKMNWLKETNFFLELGQLITQQLNSGEP